MRNLSYNTVEIICSFIFLMTCNFGLDCIQLWICFAFTLMFEATETIGNFAEMCFDRLPR